MGGTNEGHHKEHERPGQHLRSHHMDPQRHYQGASMMGWPCMRANKNSFYKSVEIRGRHLEPQDSYVLICFMTVDGCC